MMTTWDALTEAQRAILRGTPVTVRGSAVEVKTLLHQGLIRLANGAIVVTEAGHALANQQTDALTALQDQLAAVTRERDAARAALKVKQGAIDRAWKFIEPMNGDAELRALLRNYSQHDEFWESWGLAYNWLFTEVDSAADALDGE